jgi:hypothetical protein
MAQGRSKLLPESFDPLGLCTSSAVKIVTLARAFRTRYNLRNIVNIAVHAVFTASTIHLCNVASTSVSYESNARQYLSSCMVFLQEIGETWPCALRCLYIIHSLMAKFEVSMTGVAAQPLSSEEGGLPNDYTYEERDSQRTINVLATLPRILPQNLLRPFTVPQEYTAMPDVEATSQEPFEPPQEFLAQVPQQNQPLYIPADFDMSFFDVTDISLSMYDNYMDLTHNPFQ